MTLNLGQLVGKTAAFSRHLVALQERLLRKTGQTMQRYDRVLCCKRMVVRDCEWG